MELEALINALSESDEQVRKKALEDIYDQIKTGFGKSEPPPIKDKLFDLIQNDPSQAVRIRAARLFGIKIGHRSEFKQISDAARDVLLSGLNDPDDKISDDMPSLLQTFPEKRVAKALTKYMERRVALFNENPTASKKGFKEAYEVLMRFGLHFQVKISKQHIEKLYNYNKSPKPKSKQRQKLGRFVKTSKDTALLADVESFGASNNPIIIPRGIRGTSINDKPYRGYYHIEFDNGQRGWVNSNDLEPSK